MEELTTFRQVRRTLAKALVQRVVAVSLLLFFHSFEASAFKSVHSFDIGPWSGGVYVGDNKQFTFCAGDAVYNNGTSVSVYVTRALEWGILFENKKWSIPEGKTSLKYRFDRGKWRLGQGEGSETTILVAMPADDETVGKFREGRLLEIQFLEGRYGFDLKGTGRLLDELVECSKAWVLKEEDGTTSATKTDEDAKSGTSQQPSGKSSGTGFLVSRSGYILTNFHVVDGCQTVRATFNGDFAKLASVVRTDRINDLALLSISGVQPQADTATFLSPTLRAGDEIAVYGFPLAGIVSSSGNIVSGNVSSLSGIGDDVRHYQISAPVQPGNSGGPLLTMQAYVAGVVDSRLDDLAMAANTGTLPQNVNFAIKGNVVLSFLDAHSIPYEVSSSNGPETATSLREVAEKARRFTAYIECFK